MTEAASLCKATVATLQHDNTATRYIAPGWLGTKAGLWHDKQTEAADGLFVDRDRHLTLISRMRIAEIFKSRQGEGFLTGTPSVFIRVSGCNLRCVYCDTPFASWWPEGDRLTVEEIVAQTLKLGEKHVVLTGGEPMIFLESVELTRRLRAEGRHVTVETAGTRYLPVASDLMSISPKLSNSVPPEHSNAVWARRHDARRRAPNVVRRLIADYPYQLKFVVDSPSDCREVEQYLKALPQIDRGRVLLMPMGTEVERLAQTAIWLEPYCAEHGLNYCPRQHIEWFGGVFRGT